MRHLFVHTCTITRVDNTIMGGRPKGTPVEIATGERCLLEPLPSRDQVTEFGQLTQSSFVVSMRGGVDLRAQDRILIEKPAQWAGRMFTVTKLIEDTGRRYSPYKTAWLTERI